MEHVTRGVPRVPSARERFSAYVDKLKARGDFSRQRLAMRIISGVRIQRRISERSTSSLGAGRADAEPPR